MRGSVIRALGIWALLVPGAVALQPAFGDWQGFVPGLAGITAGVAVGWAPEGSLAVGKRSARSD